MTTWTPTNKNTSSWAGTAKNSSSWTATSKSLGVNSLLLLESGDHLLLETGSNIILEQSNPAGTTWSATNKS